MKKVFTTILFLTLLHGTYSQRWENIYGNQGADESFRDLTESYDKGYILSTYQENPQGNLIMKSGINGNILWDKLLFWEDTFVYSGYVTQDYNGNTIIASTINSEENGSWPMIIKLDSCGNREWCRVFPQYGYEFGFYKDILPMDNDDYLVLGHFESFEHPDQVFLDYVDKNGNMLWRKAYAKEEDYPLIASPSASGLYKNGNNYYICGSCYWPYPDNPSHVYLRPMFISIDSAFNEDWMLPFGVSDSLIGRARDMIDMNDSVFLSVGYAYKSSDILTLLACFDKDGNEIGFNRIANEVLGQGVKENTSKKIEKINDSLYIVVANWGNENIWVGGEFITDTSGNVFNYQSKEDAGGYWEIIKTSNNDFVIGTGLYENQQDWDVLLYKIDENLQSVPNDTNQYTYDSLCPYQITSGTIDLSDCLIVVDTEEIPSPEEYYASLTTIPIKVFPNPAKNKITFAFENTDKHKNIHLECYNIFGQEVHEQKIYTGQLEAEAEVSEWGKGMYVVVVKSEGEILGKGKFVVE